MVDVDSIVVTEFNEVSDPKARVSMMIIRYVAISDTVYLDVALTSKSQLSPLPKSPLVEFLVYKLSHIGEKKSSA